MTAAAASRAASAWARAYRPLAPRTLLTQLAVVGLAEVALLAGYFHHEADFHWATHFLVAVAASAVVLAAWLALEGAPAPGQLLWVLGLHLYAMFPDLLFTPGLAPHDGWMDVFLGHVSSHYVPGGEATWLAIALVASGGYAALLAAWVAARGREARAGLAPAIGVGGSALVRAQRDPRREPLAHARFGPDGPPQVLLLHGLGASRAIWRDVVAELEAGGARGLVPDLLGFGASREIGTRFDLDAHVEALTALLERREGRRLVVVGHSFGAALVVALARAAPERVASLVLVCPPVFRDPTRARERLGRRGWLARAVLGGSPAANVVCGLMCLLRAPAASAAARLVRSVPEQVARDGLQHSWPAYRDALMALLESNPLPAAIDRPSHPTAVVLGDGDEEAPAEDVTGWPHGAVELIEVGGDHLVPLRHAGLVARLVGERIPPR